MPPLVYESADLRVEFVHFLAKIRAVAAEKRYDNAFRGGCVYERFEVCRAGERCEIVRIAVAERSRAKKVRKRAWRASRSTPPTRTL